MAAGEAHWQNGIVERHIGTFRELLSKLLLEDMFEGADFQSVVDEVTEAKNRNGTYHGTSPSQWMLGKSRHPLLDSAEASPMITKGSAFEDHLARRTLAAQQFHAADAKNILHMAARARSRVISEVQAGQLVYYYRRGNKEIGSRLSRPSKSNRREKWQGEAPMIAWLSHAGTLIRAAPEHLRMATSLETRTYDLLSEASLLNQRDPATTYVDLGAIPTEAEQRTAAHMQVDEPPPFPETGDYPPNRRRQREPGLPSGPSTQRPRTREEPDGEQPPTGRPPSSSSSSSSDSSSESSESEPEPQRQQPPTTTRPPQVPPLATNRDPGLQSGPSQPQQPQPQPTQPRQPQRTPQPATQQSSRQRDRSRSPRAHPELHVQQTYTSQNDNANDVYFAQLTNMHTKRKDATPSSKWQMDLKEPRG